MRRRNPDVNLALAMLEDAALDRYDMALLISADSDLCPAVRSVRRVRPDAAVIAAFPPGRSSKELRQAASGTVVIGHDKIRRAQLPEVVHTAGGVRLRRPAYWRQQAQRQNGWPAGSA
ncbi:MAG: NYN domain-containing protein [Pseudonocardiaceae bacterium]